MATLRDLKKRLTGVKTTGQLAGAMKTVSSAKFSKLGSVTRAYKKYSSACEKLAANALSYGAEASPYAKCEKRMYILLSGNRGLCGGYNSELFSMFFNEIARCELPYYTVVCGKSAANFCREKQLESYKEFDFSDIPSYEESRRLSDFILHEWENGSVTEVFFVYQNSVNTLTHIPTLKKILPSGNGAESNKSEILFIPDKATVDTVVQKFCFETMIHSLVLECALGVQAATLIAMRSASDNAETTILSLETAINRRRQADVTSSVLETSPVKSEE